jgi:hypothetical protein
MLWQALYKGRLAKLRPIVVEASRGRERAVAEAWARSDGGEIVGAITPLVVADETILAEMAPIPVVTAPQANGGARPLQK